KSNRTSTTKFKSAFCLPDVSTRSSYNSIRSPSMYVFSSGRQNHRKKRRNKPGGEGSCFLITFQLLVFIFSATLGIARQSSSLVFLEYSTAFLPYAVISKYLFGRPARCCVTSPS